MPKVIGPTFGDEIHAAGLGGAPFAWMPGGTDEQITGRGDLTPEQNTTLDGVIAAHDPTKLAPPPPPSAGVEAKRANDRLDAGVEAAQETVVGLRRSLVPPAEKTGEVTREEFDVLTARVDAIQSALTALIEAQAG